MSETERFEPPAPTKKWPTPEELAELASKITIPEEWQTKDDPLTPETLQNVCKRLADETPMSSREWETIIKTLYNGINYSEQSEARQIWEFALERGIDSLSHLIETETKEKIHQSAAAEEEGSPYKDPIMYWLNGIAMRWHQNIIRVLSHDSGTTPEAMGKLAELMMDKASIPFTRRTKELGFDITSLRQRETPIWQTASRIVLSKVYKEGLEHTIDRKTLDAEIEQLANETLKRV